MKTIKILLVMLALTSIINVSVAQTVIYVEPNSTRRVMCFDFDGETLDSECDINLNGDADGNNQDTLKLQIGTTCNVEAGSIGDYDSYSWMGIWNTYTITIENEGEWHVSKLSNVTGHGYVGHFIVQYYDPNSVIDANDIDIKIYPNPVSEYLMINYDREIDWELMSVTGQLIIAGDCEKIDVNSLSPGYYILKVHTAEGLVIKKVLKQGNCEVQPGYFSARL